MTTEYFWTWYGAAARREIRSGVRVLQPPPIEPITIDEACLHSGIDTYGSPPEYPQETLIRAMISAARAICERYLGRSLAPQRLRYSAHEFPCVDYIELPFGPVLGIDSITYYDGVGEVVFGTENYLVDSDIEPCRVYTINGATWPTVSPPRPGGVRIEYIAGYTVTGDSPDERPLPFDIRAAILLTFGHLYENREATSAVKLEEIPMGAKSLMYPHRLRLGMA